MWNGCGESSWQAPAFEPLGVALFESSCGTIYPQLMAVAFLAIVPVLIVFLVLQRNFIEAMTMQGINR
jgi:multiple sugar transport system permease protein